jgi:hypothetical protein
MISEKLNKDFSPHLFGKKTAHIHDDQNSRHGYGLDTASEYFIGYDRECLVDNHVGQKKRNKQKVAILANRDDLLRVFALFASGKEVRIG